MRIIWMLLAVATPASAGVADLKAALAGFVGRPIAVDPRLHIPDCDYRLAWRDAGESAVVASCENPRWRLTIPLGQTPSAARAGPVMVRRGEPVQVAAAGNGFRLLVDAVAEGEGRAGGRVLVKNLNSGRRMVALVQEDGSLVLAGKNSGAGS